MAEILDERPLEIEIDCGDRRLNSRIDSRGWGAIRVRCEAGNILGIQSTIESEILGNLRSDGTTRIEAITIRGHTGCKALDMTLSVLMGDKQVDWEIMEKLVNQFKDFKIDVEGYMGSPKLHREDAARRLEQFNLPKQEANLRRMLTDIQNRTGIMTTGISIVTELTDTDKCDHNSGNSEFNLVVGKPLAPGQKFGDAAKYKEGNTYCTYHLAVHEKDASLGLKVFKTLGISDVFVAFSGVQALKEEAGRIADAQDALSQIGGRTKLDALMVREWKGRERQPRPTVDTPMKGRMKR
ncbi:MAG: hypothetical protein KGH61_02615 [Candidatus Micrarchaeota archaeon]|nr:hypothetical protein [Candidatus Micrarchaeota archaeon]MDE1847818.1 hypothetical protein [Candidatus Micrarchaeota archaeon]MDE1864376.1 hypothetical protein [Candidatus Micrarchaeota archaeon]